MSLVQAKCTSCGANIKVDQEKDAANCEFCGAAFIVEKAINNYNIANAHISTQTVNVNVGSGDFVIEKGVLKEYKGNDTHIIIPDTVKEISNIAFQDCKWLEEVTIPKSVERIMAGEIYHPVTSALYREAEVTRRERSEAVRNFGHFNYAESWYTFYRPGAFAKCERLKRIILKSSIEIPQNTFSGCVNVEQVTYPPNCSVTYTYPHNGLEWRIEKEVYTGDEIGYVLFDTKSPLSKKMKDKFEKLQEPKRKKAQEEFQAKMVVQWKREGRCEYCGGKFSFFSGVCKKCGRTKSY